jgi:prophage regulatory protein
MAKQTEQLITVRQLAEMLATSVRSVWRYRSAGKLPKPLRLGGSVRWSLKEIEAFVEAGCPDRASWEALKKAKKSGC